MNNKPLNPVLPPEIVPEQKARAVASALRKVVKDKPVKPAKPRPPL